ncbi:ATP-binding protein [Alkalihalobacterium alkalinitrilicum]|uniref:ATP-binding protein n=1 Tax=Alkalihalobacterium alkalinitrilicum TaxID=427920 RepID=UPI000995CCA5|nr:ATP-binding protein [Alkalihalobacterium alkalinitrilicum]
MLPDLYSAISAFFLNFTIILLAISLFQAFYIDKIHHVYEKRNMIILSIISSTTSVLCMTFPVSDFIHGYIFDLRFVPFLLASIYGGPIPATATTVSMISYRYFLGGEGFFITLIVQTIIFLGFLFIYRKIKKYTYRLILNLSIIFTFCLGFLIFTVGIVVFTAFQTEFVILTYAKFVIIQIVIHLIVFFITIKLIDGLLYRVRKRNYLRQTDRLQAVTDLTASVAHEIRNPLTSAKGFLQLLIREKGLTTKEKQYAELVDREILLVEKIVDEYIEIAHPSKVHLSATQLDDLLNQVCNELSTNCKLNNVSINVSIKKNGELLTDVEKLKQTLRNIIINGIEAMPNGGTISIIAKISKKYVTIEVSDEGIGMSELELDRIGTPFYSLKEKGTGLGLMLRFQLMALLGGRIEVSSMKGSGSTFTVYLPKQTKHPSFSQSNLAQKLTEGQN